MPMSSDMRNCVIFNALASGFGWAGFGVGISAVTSNSWYSTGGLNVGLWNQCLQSTNSCSALQNVEPWLNAVRAFMILYVVFIWLGSSVNISSQCKPRKNVRAGSGGIMSIAATFGVVGAAVFTATVSGAGISYGYGFGAAWGVVGAGYLGGLCNQISARYMPDTADGNCCNKSNPVQTEKF